MLSDPEGEGDGKEFARLVHSVRRRQRRFPPEGFCYFVGRSVYQRLRADLSTDARDRNSQLMELLIEGRRGLLVLGVPVIER